MRTRCGRGEAENLLRHLPELKDTKLHQNVAEGFSLRVPRMNHDVSPARSYALHSWEREPWPARHMGQHR